MFPVQFSPFQPEAQEQWPFVLLQDEVFVSSHVHLFLHSSPQNHRVQAKQLIVMRVEHI